MGCKRAFRLSFRRVVWLLIDAFWRCISFLGTRDLDHWWRDMVVPFLNPDHQISGYDVPFYFDSKRQSRFFLLCIFSEFSFKELDTIGNGSWTCLVAIRLVSSLYNSLLHTQRLVSSATSLIYAVIYFIEHNRLRFHIIVAHYGLLL